MDIRPPTEPDIRPMPVHIKLLIFFRILNLNDNTFTEKGARAMATTLKQLNSLEILNLGDCLLKEYIHIITIIY